MSDPSQNRSLDDLGAPSNNTVAPTPRPTEEEVAATIGQLENTGQPGINPATAVVAQGAKSSWIFKPIFVIVYAFTIALTIILLVWVGQRIARGLLSVAAKARQQYAAGSKSISTADSEQQREAQELLKRLASRDPAAADAILSRSSNWTGKTRRTPETDQFIVTALNLPDRTAREAAIDAQLALDGVSRNENGLELAKQAVGNPRQRSWALWTLGALGARGIDAVHTAKIVETYLNDPTVSVRAVAVDALALIATDETVPMLLDRFHNDPSPIVQERAACDLAEAGMYTHVQRMQVAGTLIGWLEDPLLTPNQRTWTTQALRDITGAPLASDAATWRQWWEQNGQR